MPPNPSVYILIPVHNRKTTTLRCLNHLAAQGNLDTFQIVVIDDGSTDGTAAAITAAYPSITVLQGDGNLWWTGAIALGMRYACKHGADYIVWLNDDTLPVEGTLQKLISYCQLHPQSIAASQCVFHGSFTYGGQRKSRFRQSPVHAESGEVIHCDALDGNLVCVPRPVIDAIGYPCGQTVPHYGGDNLYTWRAKQAGYQLCLLGDAVSICPYDHPQVSWTLDPDPIWKYWRAIASPKTSYYLPGYWHFCTGYWGTWGILSFTRPYLKLILFTAMRLLMPPSWLRSLKQKFGRPYSA